MKILVTYFSITKNTEIIAHEIFDELSSTNNEVELLRLKEIDSTRLDDYDLIFIGSACHDTDVAKPVLRFLHNFPESPNFKIAGFVTHASYLPEGSQRKIALYEEWASKCEKSFQLISEEKEIDLRGYFSCMGNPSPPIAQFVHDTIITNEAEWEEYIQEVVKHPDENDKINARKFAKKIILHY